MLMSGVEILDQNQNMNKYIFNKKLYNPPSRVGDQFQGLAINLTQIR
jgi:hypothetical protein